MGFVFAFLAASCATGNTAEADHAKYIRVHREWLRLHEADERQARLIVDPLKNAMWIENHGKVQNEYLVDLPKGFRWYAFHVSQDGISERSFPLCLTKPRADIEDESEEEALWVVAMADKASFRLSFLASRSGIAFHAGSGSRTGDITIDLPAALPKPTKLLSFVAPQSPRVSQPKDFFQMKEFAVQVKRRTTPPNYE